MGVLGNGGVKASRDSDGGAGAARGGAALLGGPLAKWRGLGLCRGVGSEDGGRGVIVGCFGWKFPVLGVGYSRCEGVLVFGVELPSEWELSGGTVWVFRGDSRCVEDPFVEQPWTSRVTVAALFQDCCLCLPTCESVSGCAGSERPVRRPRVPFVRARRGVITLAVGDSPKVSAV